MSNYTHPHPADQQIDEQVMHSESEEADEEQEELSEVAHRFLFFNVMPSWMVSFVAHVALIIALAIFWLPTLPDTRVALEAGDSDGTAIEEIESVNFEDMESIDSVLDASDSAEMAEPEISESVEEPESLADLPMADFGTELAGEESNFADDIFDNVSLTGNETSGRSEAGRRAQVRKYGGTAASENAVELALEWIARHQLPDGGWNLDHTVGPKNGKIARDKNDPGRSVAARNGATALALLPFLGHGDTHIEGKYKKVVEKGLDFLINNAKAQGRGISWHEPSGTMYSHGLVAIVFAEAYAMTQDSRLAPYAQGAIWFIEDSQDKRGGGWRYTPGEAGDTSAVGWQLMALKSAKLSGLEFEPKTIKGAEKFLDSVSIEYGAWYGYMTPPRSMPTDGVASYAGCSAVGLLCRMYMGWDRENKGLRAGVAAIKDIGPSVGSDQRPEAVNMYYNYYATQLLKHWGGEEWRDWNKVMRDFLVKEQDTEGTKKGSWHWEANSHSSEAGGRLYQTALATMTLEVYYRYLPLYKDEAAEDDFPLE